MADEANEELDSQNQPTEEVEETLDELNDQSVADTDEDIEDVDELKEKLQKTTAQNQKLFERAKKAEGFEKQPDGSWVKVEKKPKAQPEPQAQTKSDDLSSRDVMALMNAKVTEDADIDEVRDYAKLKGISIPEALKASVVQTILSERAEERKTAQATNTGRSRTASQSVSGEALLAKASKTGEVPEGEDLDKMLEARYTPPGE